MSKILKIEFSGSWVLKHINEEKKPVEIVEAFLQKTYGDKISVTDASFTELSASFNGATLTDSDVLSEVEKFICETFQLSKADGVVTVSVVDESSKEEVQVEKPKSEMEQMVSALIEKSQKGADAPKAGAEQSKTETTETEDVLQKCLAEIASSIGGEEFKSLAKEIAAVAPSIVADKTAELFTYQSYLFAINDGYGLMEYLAWMSKLIQAAGIREVNGIDPYEVVVLHADRDAKSPEQQIKSALCSSMRGKLKILCLDISEWMNKLDTKAFKDGLALLENSLNDFVVVFRIPFVDKEVLEQVRYSLNDIMYVRTVSFPPYDHDELQQCASAQLEKFGFKMSKTAWEYFHQRLAEERSDGKFYGLNTVKKVVRELLYKKQLSNALHNKKDYLISAKDAKEICENASASGVSGYDLLDKMVGGKVIRQRLDEIITQIELAKKSNLDAPCIHMRFVGNPGTGKTTVARIVGKILKERGILRIGNFYEYAGRDFCGQYIGETAPKTAGICRDAYGSVLFIDEAYSLYRGEGSGRDYGREALDTLIAEMENHRTDLVVIMAGYTDEMETLMKGNAGLASRMPYVIEFPNFNRDELYTIYSSMISKFKYTDDLLSEAKAYFDSLPDAMILAKEFSNGRFVRNLFERTWAKAAMRCQLAKIATVTLTKDDFVRATSDAEFKLNAPKKKRTIGFID